jgi:hypothetical protein
VNSTDASCSTSPGQHATDIRSRLLLLALQRNKKSALTSARSSARFRDYDEPTKRRMMPQQVGLSRA